MLKFQCRQPNRTTMARTLNLALLLGHLYAKSLGIWEPKPPGTLSVVCPCQRTGFALYFTFDW